LIWLSVHLHRAATITSVANAHHNAVGEVRRESRHVLAQEGQVHMHRAACIPSIASALLTLLQGSWIISQFWQAATAASVSEVLPSTCQVMPRAAVCVPLHEVEDLLLCFLRQHTHGLTSALARLRC